MNESAQQADLIGQTQATSGWEADLGLSQIGGPGACFRVAISRLHGRTRAKFHWHVENLGILHAYFKHGPPQFNGKAERSHRSDDQEFHQLLSYKGDADLEAKLDQWEHFYNFH